jgi:competence protein ComEC
VRNPFREERRTDVPAALPLIGFLSGLASGPLLVNPRAAIVALLVVALLLRTRGALALFAALGLVVALHVQRREARELAAFQSFDADRFVTIDAQLEHDWMPRDDVSLLRVSRFRANGVAFNTPLTIAARFTPPPLRMFARVHTEGFLRRGEDGRYNVAVKSPQLLAYAGALPRWHPAAWNRLLANRLAPHATRHPDEVALAQALVLGRGERLSEEIRAGFRRGGTYHLLVFSGLQIAFAAMLLAALLRGLQTPRVSDWLLLGVALLAPPFIGPTASVARSSVGIGVYALARLARRPTSLTNLWCVAALLRLALEPRDLFDPAFHLTYAGAAALLFAGNRLGRPRWLAHIVAAEVVLTPLVLFHFHQYALGGALLTIVLAPLIFAMLVVSAAACAVPCDALFAVLALLHRVCMFVNRFGLSGTFAAPPPGALVVAAFVALLAIAFLRERTRAIAVLAAMLIPTGAAIVKSHAEGNIDAPRVTFFDVGQGDAIAIRTRTATLLVDGGRGTRIVQLLADRGVRRLDAVFLTHAHPDHCDGVPAVIEQFHVANVYVTPRRFRGDCAARLLDACITTHTPVHIVRDGDAFAFGDLRIDALAASHTFRRAPENNASLVLRVAAGGRRFLLTGDIEREAEFDLAGRELRADVLKVAHHGSRTSTSAMLLGEVAPRIAVISCGRQNLFGHPHASVLAALAARNIRTWRTDRDGSIDVEVRAGRLYVRARKD